MWVCSFLSSQCSLHPKRESCVIKPLSLNLDSKVAGSVIHHLLSLELTAETPAKRSLCGGQGRCCPPAHCCPRSQPRVTAVGLYLSQVCTSHLTLKSPGWWEGKRRLSFLCGKPSPLFAILKVLQSLDRHLHNCLTPKFCWSLNASSLWQRFQPWQDLKKAFNPGYFLFRLIALPNTYTSYKDNPSFPHLLL